MTSADRAAPPRETYLTYLTSPEWRAKRNAALQRARWRCERCGAKRDLQVHHTTYERLGAERDADLRVWCFTCHRQHHVQVAEGTSLGLYLKLADQALRAAPFRSIADLSEDTKRLCVQFHIPIEPDKVAKAIALVVGSRLSVTDFDGRMRRYVSVVELPPDTPLSHAQACELLTRLGLDGVAQRFFKSMPDVTPLTRRKREVVKALQMVEREILVSIERCEALEREAENHSR